MVNLGITTAGGMPAREDFKPAWWLPGGHSQTLWPYLFNAAALPDLRTERLELPDGDFVDLSITPGKGGAVVAVFHGLEGCIRSHYARRLMRALKERNWHGVFMHFRGCSGEHNRLQRSYHSGDTGDIGHLLDNLRRQYPDSPLFAVGYSLGGNALLKYLGERGDMAPLQAAVAVSAPLVLSASADRLKRGLSRLYQWHLLRRLKRKLISKNTARSEAFKQRELSRLHTFFEFDEHVTAPLHGFSGAEDYYRQASSRQYLPAIRVPTLIIHAMDDPFMGKGVIPADHELGEGVQLELYRHGGHVGFVTGQVPWQPVYWLDRRIIHYLQQFAGGRERLAENGPA